MFRATYLIIFNASALVALVVSGVVHADPANPPSKKCPSDEFQVTMQRGDTLQQVSMRYLGTTRKWEKIYAYNQKKVGDPSQLAEGTTLTLLRSWGTTEKAGDCVAPALLTQESEGVNAFRARNSVKNRPEVYPAVEGSGEIHSAERLESADSKVIGRRGTASKVKSISEHFSDFEI